MHLRILPLFTLPDHYRSRSTPSQSVRQTRDVANRIDFALLVGDLTRFKKHRLHLVELEQAVSGEDLLQGAEPLAGS